MRNTSISIFAVAIAATCGAAELHWTGAGGNNEWTNALNWAESTVPGNGHTAVFTNSAPLDLRINSSGYSGAEHFRFLGADVSIKSDSGNTLYIYGDSITSTVEVVAGTVVTCSNYIWRYHSSSKGLAKKGGGTFRYDWAGGLGGVTNLVVENGRFELSRTNNTTSAYSLSTGYSMSAVSGGDLFLGRGYTSLSGGGGLSLNGGTLSIDVMRTPNWYILGDSSSRQPRIAVGAEGGTFSARNLPVDAYNSDNIRVRMYTPVKAMSGLVTDGGMTFDMREIGVSVMPLEPFSLNGPVKVMDGRLMISRYSNAEYADLASHPSFLGTGDFILDCSLLDYLDESGNLPEGTLRLASGAGSVMRVRGSSEIRLRASTSKNVQHIVVGADGASSNSALVRERGGAFFLHDGGAVLGGNAPPCKVNGGVATNEHTTLVKAPIFSEHAMGGNAGMFFLCYDVEKGFYEFTNEATTLTDDEHSVVGGKIYVSLAENATAHIAALHLEDWGSLTLNEGSCLTIGNGIDPACLLLGYKTHVNGTGTIDFGDSEGVVALGIMLEVDANQYGGHRLECRLSGSGGVSYVARSAYGFRSVSVSGENDYKGDTHISVATVVARNAHAFGSGDVYVDGGYRNGGKIVFDRPLTFTNAFHVSGAGHRLKQYDPNFFGRGALSFLTNDVVLTGPVELAAKTDVSAKYVGASGTFAGTISGDKLVVQPGEGSVVLAANNTYTGGTEIVSAKVELRGASPSLGTGRVKLDNGIVWFENSSPITFANSVEGTGTFRVLGSDVTFTSPQINGGSPTVATAGTRVEFANGVARVIHPRGMAIIFK